MINNKKAGDLLVPISGYPHISEDASVKEAFLILRHNFEGGAGYRSILVLNEKDQLKGVLGLRDLIRAIEPQFLKAIPPQYQGAAPEYPALTLIWQELFSTQSKEAAQKPVRHIMTPVKATVSLDDSVAKIAYLILLTNSNILPVVDKGRAVGVVRLVDVFNEIAKEILTD